MVGLEMPEREFEAAVVFLVRRRAVWKVALGIMEGGA